MMQEFSKWARATVGLLCLSSTTGCSFLFVRGTSSNDGITRAGKCTSSRLAPALDTTFGALQLVRTGLAASAPDRVYANPDAPLSREADVALGVSFATLFVSSAIYGFVSTNHCGRLKGNDRKQAPDDPPETWAPSPQGAQPAPPPSSAAAAPLPSVAPATPPAASTPPPPAPATEPPAEPELLPRDAERLK